MWSSILLLTTSLFLRYHYGNGGDLDHDIKNIPSFVPKKSISDYTLFANIGPEK